jgi:hypothetical protein
MAGKYKYMVQGGCKSMALRKYKYIMLCQYKSIVLCKRKCMMPLCIVNHLFSIVYD